MQTTERTILLTGATDGIGLALARIYLEQAGVRLIGVGRRPPENLPPSLQVPAFTYCQTDLATPDCQATVGACLAAHGIDRLDLLIHNAAVGYYGPTATQSPQSIHELVGINLRAPITLTYTLLPLLLESRRASPAGQIPPGEQPKIVFVSSVVSTLPCPSYAIYGATKAALDGFARSLRVELRGKCAVQVLHPGPTHTGIHARSGVPLERLRPERFPSAEVVAAQAAQAIAGTRPTVALGWTNWLVQLAGRHTGGLVDLALKRRLAQEHGTEDGER